MNNKDIILDLEEIKKAIENRINTDLDMNSIGDCRSFAVVIQQINVWRDYLTQKKRDIRNLHNNIKSMVRDAEKQYKHAKNLALLKFKKKSKENGDNLPIDIIKAQAEISIREHDDWILELKKDEKDAQSISDYADNVDKRLADMATSARKISEHIRDEMSRISFNRSGNNGGSIL